MGVLCEHLQVHHDVFEVLPDNVGMDTVTESIILLLGCTHFLKHTKVILADSVELIVFFLITRKVKNPKNTVF